MIKHSEPIFAASDIRETVRFYRQILGFESEWFWQDPPTFAGVRWSNIHVMFCLQPEMKGKIEGLQHSFFAKDIQSLYERHKSLAAPIISDIENKPWGIREYTVRDPNGYHLRFGGPEKYEKPKTAIDILPSHIRIKIGKPSVDEYSRMLDAVGWNKRPEILAGALEISTFCAMAINDRDGKLVGMTRVCGDGRNFMIWDVMVAPAYQNQKIGATLMTETVTELRRIAPTGSFCALFTGKSKFYEQFGFHNDAGGMSMVL